MSVIGGDGSHHAFLLQGGQPARSDDDGPVVDMFQGQLALQPGDYIISADTHLRRTGPSLEGQVPLTDRDGWLVARVAAPGRPAAPFILDTASEGTEVAKAFLPAQTEVRPAQAHEYSPLGVRAIEQKASGAGGTIETFLGYAKLAELDAGSLHLPEVTAGVLAEPVTSGEEPVLGILGLDLLQRADVVAFAYPHPGADKSALTFSSRSTLSGADVIELPLFLVSGHIFVRGEVGGKPVFFILDTGARDSVISSAFAPAGLNGRSQPARQVRGADNRPITVQPATLQDLALGQARFHDVVVNVADLPVLKTFGVQDLAGVLGNSFLSRFRRVEIDFAARRLRLLQ